MATRPRSAAKQLVDGDPADGRFTVALTDDNDRLVGVVGVGGARTANALKPAVLASETLDEFLRRLACGSAFRVPGATMSA